jgi:trk system potassium uptake protein
MRILIVGGGEIGHALARALAPITPSRSSTTTRRPRPVSQISTSSSSPAARPAPRRSTGPGPAKADLLVACTGLDEVNLVACAIAHRLGVGRTICFVSREDFVGDESSLREHFGIERVVWPEAQLAEEIERIIAAPGRHRRRDLRRRPDPAARVPAPGRLRGCSRPAQDAPGAPRRADRGRDAGETIEIPHGDTRLVAGDKIIVMGTPEALEALQPAIEPARGAAHARW